MEGQAPIPRVRETGTVFARHLGAWGLCDYDSYDEQVIVELRSERGFEVRVLSSKGVAAAGVDVVFRSIDYFGIQYQTTTDTAGLARFRHLRPFQPFGEREPCEVTLRGLLVNRPARSFESQEDIPPRVELNLPPCGSLEVQLVGQDGAPVFTPAEFQFVMMRDEAPSDWVFGSVLRSSPNGSANVAWVEVGAAFEATGAVLGAREGARVTARGPATVDGVVDLTLKIVPTPAAVFRAVDERGAVLASRALAFVVRDQIGPGDDSAPWPARATATDAMGTFRLPFHEPFPGEDVDEDYQRTIDVLCAPGEDGVERHFRAKFDGRPREADVEFGEAAFLRAQPIVAGHVIDEVGAPVEGALVRVSTHDMELSPRERERNSPRELACALSDANGAFAVTDSTADTHLRVSAIWGVRRSATLDVLRGASDLVLVLPRTGGLAGSLLIPKRVMPSGFRVEWTHDRADPAVGSDHRTYAVQAAEPELARFLLQALPPGPGTLRITIDGHEVARIDAVVVRAGETLRDPRMQRLDLRGRVRSLRVRVDGPDGRPAENGVVRTMRSAEGAEFDWRMPGQAIVNGSATWFVPAVPLDLCIVVPEMRRALILGVTQEEVRVRLQPGYEVSIRFRGPRLSELDGVHAYLSAPGESAGYAVLGIDGDGLTARQRVSASGPVSVWLRLPRTDELLGGWTLTVLDTDAPQDFVLEVDPQRIDEALK